MQIKTPDIGVDKANVAEILVKVGDRVEVDDSIVVLESDKATVEVPSTSAGVVKSILINQGDDVTEGVALIEIEAEGAAQPAPEPTPAPAAEKPAAPAPAQQTQASAQPAAATSSATVEVTVPDIGVEKALVGEILVKVGDQIDVEQSIVVVESDKATVEVPSSVAGTVESIQVKEGDTVKEGVVLIQVKTAAASNAQAEAPATTPAPAPAAAAEPVAAKQKTVAAAPAQSGSVDINVPDLGVDKAVVAEILVQVGDKVDVDQSLVVVESDKATVEVPSTVAGIVKAIHLQAGQQVSQGVLLATIEAEGQAPAAAPAAKAEAAPAPQAAAPKAAAPVATQSAPAASTSGTDKLTKEQEAENAKVYAGPAVRKLARELGVILSQVKTSGEHGRVVKEDIFAYVKSRLTAPQAAPVAQATAAPAGLPSLPDFTAFGGGEVKPMTRLQQVSVPQLSLNNYIPQVTQFDLADITELEAWRGELKDGFKKQGVSLTILAFIAKAVAHLLKEEPYFAGHLADDQKSVLLRNEIHMGIAVATPDGLTVPVLRNPDQKSIKQIAVELGELSKKARDKKLTPKDLQGANFTITSLGSIGGTAFTPLVNWPQVAILGISPATMQPVWNGKDFDPRLMLPLSLSYDHRVINGADAARFTNKLTKLLKDIRTLLI
ncbi:2-oxo acid dehydrogenase subunit E2 [Acinetobacter baumannii]|jgi:pyruvate dehydrogenase complex dihydrolipoamide acetyltransferase, long form|uniref:Dihydrolipoamide acetyltransferase component of pyruvate dehydrogenase complex n=16 Tax=Acinetobacter baumannii TaxID=470 RepID=A0A1L5TM51_ACIBA|nr:2-oxo acid dehydrogenase subunit E2 [Acinetobacter baumannii]ABO13716.2 dihydrolipoamide S-acetyltransferase E2 component of the pyruvate dehydrogenase complex [Acinetobacter baumannii ATCC 17978]AKQ25334.1 dihydrolipoamide acetyltransferase [Acinetobacter baumannii]APP30337.1 pyruvate dehydrogenase complex dihydrolipoyllysine-residue acetyltransferase [Acinetobacter baumannii]APX48806.1 pyruvate dehydrogenase complex dihydrolipoyllysine-residue acetyltransferase [Acinetobacter baumannii]EH